jgi:hypothetical protein
MRAFIFAAVAAVVIATAAHFGLDAVQQSSALAYSTGGARLDSQESVNNYGREG